MIRRFAKLQFIMASIFNKTNNLFENPNRNTFDLSFQNNLTLNMGELVPVMCKECLPGDSFKIDPTISLRMMPLLFPVQTRLRAHLHFFYVTNRSLWKDWQDFIGNTKQSLELPYIRNDFKTGSLGDYLGLPTTVSKGTPKQKTNSWWNGQYINQKHNGKSFGEGAFSYNLSPSFGSVPSPIIYNSLIHDKNFTYSDFVSIFDEINYSLGYTGSDSYIPNLDITETNNYKWSSQIPYSSNRKEFNTVVREGGLTLDDDLSAEYNISFLYYCPNLDLYPIDSFGEPLTEFKLFEGLDGISNEDYGNPSKNVNVVLSCYDSVTNTRYYGVLTISKQVAESGILLTTDTYINVFTVGESGYTSMKISEFRELATNSLYQCFVLFQNYTFTVLSNDVDSSQVNNVNYGFVEHLFTPGKMNNYTLHVLPSRYSSTITYSPTSDIEDWSDPNETLKINALPFRAYEAIYNSFYRDERNNPLIENGEPIYNKWILNDAGGLDTVVNKELYKRNWQSDFLTTAVQSPQQGVAPLVGITARGEISFRDEDTGEIYTAKLNTSNGDAIDSFTVTSPNMPQGNLRQLVDFASSGISISDLRGVNALQRWLEINMRRGLRYKDQIKSHFGVDVRFDELMMPEFIGGLSTDIYVNQINQTTPTDGQPLGWFAGQGGAFESAKHSISHYCQEHGYIIGILSIEPTPQYSQLLPKHFLKSQLLDYYFPEFGHLGMQPILYSEVAPNETLYSGQDLNDTFGYQRAWYDYLASTDEVHGLFRTTLSNFVVQRMFDGRPELSKSFLTIDPKTLDSVFAVESGTDSHKFLGQVYFDIKCKRPIPEYGIPKLEV